MKIGKLMTTNTKGQIVIPQEYRDLLGITQDTTLNIFPQSTGLFLQPIQQVIPKIVTQDVYSQLLEKTKGSWSNDDFDKTRKDRKLIELTASKKRKQTW